MIDKLEINIHEREGWLSASVEDYDGVVLASDTAPIVDGATFDIRRALILAVIAEAIEPRERT